MGENTLFIICYIQGMRPPPFGLSFDCISIVRGKVIVLCSSYQKVTCLVHQGELSVRSFLLKSSSKIITSSATSRKKGTAGSQVA